MIFFSFQKLWGFSLWLWNDHHHISRCYISVILLLHSQRPLKSEKPSLSSAKIVFDYFIDYLLQLLSILSVLFPNFLLDRCSTSESILVSHKVLISPQLCSLSCTVMDSGLIFYIDELFFSCEYSPIQVGCILNIINETFNSWIYSVFFFLFQRMHCFIKSLILLILLIFIIFYLFLKSLILLISKSSACYINSLFLRVMSFVVEFQAFFFHDIHWFLPNI